jgi:archaellum component FlaF (FlaF/FlaG flagellin family)
MKQLLACLSIAIILVSCAAGHKKVYVLTQGTLNVDTDNRKIVSSGKGHNEKEVLLYDEGKTSFDISSDAGNATVTMEENGIYIINAKKDTVVGSWVNYTAPKTAVEKISEEDLRSNIDSLQQIIDGKVSIEKKTFYILPNQAVRITSNTEAHVVTPFHQMTSVEVKKGEAPEVYRFYLISEARATMQKLKGFLGEGNQPVNQ